MALPGPFKALFETIARPLAVPSTPDSRHRDCAFDGLNSLRVPDTERNRGWLGRICDRVGWAGYPKLRPMTLVATDTTFWPLKRQPPGPTPRPRRSEPLSVCVWFRPACSSATLRPVAV